ncbi:MAG: nucleoside-diphosphate sugar epimerase/dehydratase [Syntrophomonas sp.]|uniref:nucleoside-diphosphate sugar epimerase/dehydratase n=1 Tax=Syntrophomonas sp. TaxID=2053627 RepID=UPI0026032867|nr:nucleoside-diphosphate sugar epimerase/dehydratase [Syntrophomonas sp.]MDD4627391.1 nucleoside-diphosphate sugar epimerase/dehydratase [Syntrophomonas sp.]
MPVQKARACLMIIIDAILVNMAFYSAMLLRFDANIPQQYIQSYISLIPLITGITLLFLLVFRLYSRIWEYASINEMWSIALAASSSMLCIYAVLHYLFQAPFSRSIYVLAWVFISLFIGVSRLWWRLFRDFILKPESNRRRVLIVGAGDAGALLAREIQNNHQLGIEAVAFVDDDPGKKQKMLMGLPVKGGRQQIPVLVENMAIDEIIIAMPSVCGNTLREIVDICRQTSVSLKILPSIYRSSQEGNIISNLREVQMEDLLGREAVEIDLVEITSYLHDKTVLVTGGGGSIGSELCRQIVRFKPLRLVIIDSCENNLFDIEMELKSLAGHCEICPELLDTRREKRLEACFQKYNPQVVFHAAAFKHVPMMERHPELAIDNNVLGTRNVADMADKYRAEVFILISTDKAVNPTSVMGASKRVAELLVKDLNLSSHTRFAAVRFGNVLGSRGSVIPTFIKQIEQGGPVTVTHPEMQRYFMTIPEAVELVIQAGAIAQGGEIFVLDMGDPVKIDDLARDLIRLAGYEPDKDIAVVYSGIRPGEKLYEELFSSREEMAATRHKRIFISQKELDKNYSGIFHSIKILGQKASQDSGEARQLLSIILPEYTRTALNLPPQSAEIIYLEPRDKKRSNIFNKSN